MHYQLDRERRSDCGGSRGSNDLMVARKQERLSVQVGRGESKSLQWWFRSYCKNGDEYELDGEMCS